MTLSNNVIFLELENGLAVNSLQYLPLLRVNNGNSLFDLEFRLQKA